MGRLWGQRRFTVSKTLTLRVTGQEESPDDAGSETQSAAHQMKKDLAIRTSVMRRLERTMRNPPQRPDKNGKASPMSSTRIFCVACGWLRAARVRARTTPEIRERLLKKGARETDREAWRRMNRETAESQKVPGERT